MSVAAKSLCKLLKANLNLSATKITETTQAILAKCRQIDEAIINVKPEDRNFDNIFKISLDYDTECDMLCNSVVIPKHISNSEEVRDAACKAGIALDEYSIERHGNVKLYEALSSFNESRKQKNIHYDPTIERYISETLNSFERNGISLPEEKRHLYEEKKKAITNLATQFAKNIADDTRTLHLSEEETKGIPADFLEGLKKDEEGSYIFEMTFSHYSTILRCCELEDTRKRAMLMYQLKGGKENIDILKKIVDLRRESASLLGYPNYATFAVKDRMAKTPENVRQFNNDLYTKLYPCAVKDIDAIKAYKKQKTGSDELHHWDITYYENLMSKELYNVDTEALRLYFPVTYVVDKAINIAETLYGLKFVKSACPNSWDDSVLFYEVYNTNTAIYPEGTCNKKGEVDEGCENMKGFFFLDLYPRANKYSHACACNVQNPGYIQGDKVLSSVLMICNFNKPAKGETTGYCTHDDVTTFLHEFGHCLHQLCTDVTVSSLSGMTTQDDFVEAPSQFFERFAWDKEVIRSITKHKVTHESLSDDLIDSIIKAKNFNQGYMLLRQVLYGQYDFRLHSEQVDDLYLDMEKALNLYIPNEKSLFPAAFGHLTSSMYAAGYYGYNWADCYAADFFDVFKQHGVMNKELGTKFRKEVLSQGNSKPGLEIAEQFLGRKVNLDALLKDKGFL
ncbi:hypothetical protein WA158_005474 [Blastocystis sp. Blastoise]